MIKTTEEFYVLVEKKTGKPVHVASNYNGDSRYACGEHTFRLTRDESEPLYKAETLLQAWLTMKADIHWYNSDDRRPCWSDGLDNETLEIAKHIVVTETVIDKGPFKLPLMAAKEGRVDTRDIPAVVARRVFNKPDLDSVRRYTTVLYDTMKEGATQADEFEKAIGQFVYFDDYVGRHLYAVVTAREEYQDRTSSYHGDLELLCGPMGDDLS